MTYVVHLANRAEKGIRNIPTTAVDRILSTLEEMETDPLSGDIVKLKGTDAFRRRVGNYRIIFSIDTNSGAVYIMDILRRTSTTY